MKIHYLVTSLENGGAEFAMPAILQTLRKHNCQIQVTACEPRDMKAAPKLEAANIPYTIMFDGKRNKLTYISSFLKILRNNRPDIIWTSLSAATLVGQIAGKILGIPVVSWKHSASVRSYTQLLRNLTQLWIADSALVEQFLHSKMRIPTSRIMTWPLYVCDDSTYITTYWDGKRPLHLGSMGRLREQKNYSALIKGIQNFRLHHPNLINRLRVSIAGEGPLKTILQSEIKQYGLDEIITLIGYCDDTSSFLKTLDVYIQPSLFEGMCLAAHEAMAMGLPVIATPVGELAFSVINNKTGFIIGNNVENDLSKILETIFSQPNIIANYGVNARNFVENKYSKEAFDAAAINILDRVKTTLLCS